MQTCVFQQFQMRYGENLESDRDIDETSQLLKASTLVVEAIDSRRRSIVAKSRDDCPTENYKDIQQKKLLRLSPCQFSNTVNQFDGWKVKTR